MSDIDRIISALSRVSEAARIQDLKHEADQTDRRRCGNCIFWMKDCPREVRGGMRG